MGMKKLAYRARTTEVDDTSDRLLQLYAAQTALKSEAFLKPLFAEMQNLSDRITEAIRRDRALSDLEDADLHRDQAVTSLFKIVEGYSHIPLDSLRTPAQQLWKILSKFGTGITRENFATESSLIEALLTDLNSPDAQPKAEELPGVSEAITTLRTAQTDFNAKRVAYEQNKAGQKEAENAVTLKAPLVNLINNRLLPYLQAMKMADESKYGALANGVEQSITTTNAAIAQRAKPKDKNPKDATPREDPPKK